MFKKIRAAALVLPMVITAAPALASPDQPEPVTVPTPPPGKAQIVFFRDGGYAGSAISCAVSENGTKLSSLPPRRFFILVADPGKHTYSVSSEAKDEIFFDLKPGQTTFVKCHVEMGFFAGHPKLDVAEELQFTTKTWKSVEKSRMGPNVLTDEQIKLALATQAAPAPDGSPPAPPAPPAPAAPPPAPPAQ
jgi:hypothetical protein